MMLAWANTIGWYRRRGCDTRQSCYAGISVSGGGRFLTARRRGDTVVAQVLDASGAGELSCQRFGDGLAELGIEAEELTGLSANDLFDELDMDASGAVGVTDLIGEWVAEPYPAEQEDPAEPWMGVPPHLGGGGGSAMGTE